MLSFEEREGNMSAMLFTKTGEMRNENHCVIFRGPSFQEWRREG